MERVFSKGQIVFSYVWNRLSAQSIRALLCLSNWSRLGYVRDKDVLAVTMQPDLEREEDYCICEIDGMLYNHGRLPCSYSFPSPLVCIVPLFPLSESRYDTHSIQLTHAECVVCTDSAADWNIIPLLFSKPPCVLRQCSFNLSYRSCLNSLSTIWWPSCFYLFVCFPMVYVD